LLPAFFSSLFCARAGSSVSAKLKAKRITNWTNKRFINLFLDAKQSPAALLRARAMSMGAARNAARALSETNDDKQASKKCWGI
jgi:hypothetical protein